MPLVFRFSRTSVYSSLFLSLLKKSVSRVLGDILDDVWTNSQSNRSEQSPASVKQCAWIWEREYVPGVVPAPRAAGAVARASERLPHPLLRAG